MYIHERPEHLGHPLSKGLEKFIQNLTLNPIKSIDGLSGREEQEAIETIEEELDYQANSTEIEMDDDSGNEEEIPDTADFYNY